MKIKDIKEVVDYKNIIVNEYVINKKIEKNNKTRSNIGNTLNKKKKDLRIEFKDKLKILKLAKKQGHFSLHSYVKVYRKYIAVSYEYLHKKIREDKEFTKYLIDKGILIQKINKTKMEAGKLTYNKFYIITDIKKRKEFLRICLSLTRLYQREQFLKTFSNNL